MSDPTPDPGRDPQSTSGAPDERILIHRVLRYVPNLLRDEWVNIGVLLYDPNTGERRLRLIESATEFLRVRRLHPHFDERSLRGLRDHLESRFGAAMRANGNGGSVRGTLRNGLGNPLPNATDWFQVLEKCDATLSQSLQLADPKATTADDINSEIDRLYDERVAVLPWRRTRVGRPNNRLQMRRYCEQVFRQARIWDRIGKSVRVSDFTKDGDPMRIDFGYARNDQKMRGFVQTIPLISEPHAAHVFALAAQRIRSAAQGFDAEFTAVTDINLDLENDRHRSISEMLGRVPVEHVPLEGFAVWVANLRPMLLQ